MKSSPLLTTYSKDLIMPAIEFSQFPINLASSLGHFGTVQRLKTEKFISECIMFLEHSSFHKAMREDFGGRLHQDRLWF